MLQYGNIPPTFLSVLSESHKYPRRQSGGSKSPNPSRSFAVDHINWVLQSRPHNYTVKFNHLLLMSNSSLNSDHLLTDLSTAVRLQRRNAGLIYKSSPNHLAMFRF